MADSIGWKTTELQIETLIPGILLILGIDAVGTSVVTAGILSHVRDDSFVKISLFVTASYAAGVLGSLFCRAILDGLSEWGLRSWVFAQFAHVDEELLRKNRLARDKDGFETDEKHELDVRKRTKKTAFWNAAYRSVLRTTTRKDEVDRRRSQGRILRNLAFPASLWGAVTVQSVPCGHLLGPILAVVIFFAWSIPYAYAEYFNFAEAYDLTERELSNIGIQIDAAPRRD